MGRILRVDERADVRDAERAEQLFALGRGEPMLGVLDVVMGNHGGHTFSWRQRPAVVSDDWGGSYGLFGSSAGAVRLCQYHHAVGSTDRRHRWLGSAHG